MKFTTTCVSVSAATLLTCMPAFAAGQHTDEKPLQQDQQVQQVMQHQQMQQGVQTQQLQHAGQSSLIVRETDDGMGGIQQEVRSLTIELNLEQMTEQEIEAAFASAEPVEGINVAIGEDDAIEMIPRRGFRRGYYGRGYGPRFYGPRFNPYYYGAPYYYPAPNAAWWLLPFLFR